MVFTQIKNIRIVSDSTENKIREIKFFYPSGNISVYGELFLPSVEHLPFKLIVFNHGGINGLYKGMRFISRWLASGHGFAVFTPSYRGEDGSEGYIEIAKGEVDDVLNGLYLLMTTSLFDKNDVFMVGSSHGALITLIAMAKDEPNLIKKGVFGYGIADIYRWWDYLEGNEMLEDDSISSKLYPGHPDDYPDFYSIRHGLNYVSKIKSPILIVQGEEDRLVPIEQAEILKRALDEANVTNKLVLIPNAGHGFLTKRHVHADGSETKSEECETAWKEILRFFDE